MPYQAKVIKGEINGSIKEVIKTCTILHNVYKKS